MHRFVLLIIIITNVLIYQSQSISRSINRNISEYCGYNEQNAYNRTLLVDSTKIADKSILGCHTTFGVYAVDAHQIPIILEIGGMYKYLLSQGTNGLVYGQFILGVSYEPYVLLELNLNVCRIFHSNMFVNIGCGFRNKLGNGTNKAFDSRGGTYYAYFNREYDIYLPLELGVDFSWLQIGLFGRYDIKPSADITIIKIINYDNWDIEKIKAREFSMGVRLGVKLK